MDSVVGIGRYSKQIEVERKQFFFFKKTTANPAVLKVYKGDIIELPFSTAEIGI